MTEFVITVQTVQDESKIDLVPKVDLKHDHVNRLDEPLDEQIAKHIGELESTITTDELMAITRGE